MQSGTFFCTVLYAIFVSQPTVSLFYRILFLYINSFVYISILQWGNPKVAILTFQRNVFLCKFLFCIFLVIMSIVLISPSWRMSICCARTFKIVTSAKLVSNSNEVNAWLCVWLHCFTATWQSFFHHKFALNLLVAHPDGVRGQGVNYNDLQQLCSNFVLLFLFLELRRLNSCYNWDNVVFFSPRASQRKHALVAGNSVGCGQFVKLSLCAMSSSQLLCFVNSFEGFLV